MDRSLLLPPPASSPPAPSPALPGGESPPLPGAILPHPSLAVAVQPAVPYSTSRTSSLTPRTTATLQATGRLLLHQDPVRATHSSGRGKALRWRDSSPSSDSLDVGSPSSFKDVLLAGTISTSVSVSSGDKGSHDTQARTLQASVQNSSGVGGRFVHRSSPLRSLVQPMRQKPLVDREGFTLVESRCTQKQRRRLERSFGIQALETFKGGASSASHLTTGLPSVVPSSVASFAIRLGIHHMLVRVATRLTDSNLPFPRSARAWLDVCMLLFIDRLLSMRRSALLKMQGGHSLMRAVVVGVAWCPALLLTLSAQRSHILLLLGSSHGLQVSTRGLKCLIVPLFSM
ncbi:hypothetical protein Zm00014a_039982 [Zea mays]|uniref:Uncharacterized protein n=1 Tax=Zea mays TaxID=4577 RepID=A0A3L6EKH1_MAIZE|nr:hypothetical protein Zm00014a_039982 [Zea mays]